MKTKLVAALAFAAVVGSHGLLAQAPQPASPTTPPAVTSVAPAPDQVIYTPRLPEVREITGAAAAQGLAIERIEQTSVQLTVIYKLASGQLRTVAYQTLSTAGSDTPTPTAPAVQAPQTVVVRRPAPAVVYDYPPPWSPGYYYYDSFYDPWYWYPPVSFRIGLGYRSGHYRSGHYRSGHYGSGHHGHFRYSGRSGHSGGSHHRGR